MTPPPPDPTAAPSGAAVLVDPREWVRTVAGVHRWPLEQLTVTTPRVTLKLPDAVELEALADAVAAGLFEEGSNLTFAWHHPDPAIRARNTIQWHHSCIGRWSAEDWDLCLAVLHNGDVIGTQSLRGTEFAVRRTVRTGSFLTPERRGAGIGTEMRAGILTLAKAIGAHRAETDALIENHASAAVTTKLGYHPDGVRVTALAGEARILQHYTLDLTDWEPPVDVHIAGLDATTLELFGAPDIP